MTQQDYLLDHQYDGIQEYDNPLPGWWVLIFWATIIISPFYWLFYHWGTGTTIADEYALAQAAFYEKQAEKFVGMEINERTLWDMMQDPNLLAGMQKRFVAKCATCHKPGGEGDACPNLTDDYWLHGGDLMAIYKTILKGIPGTEMKSWETELGPAGVLTMAAYVGSLRGTNLPGGKEREGRKYEIVEPPANDAPKTADTTADAPKDGPAETPAEGEKAK